MRATSKLDENYHVFSLVLGLLWTICDRDSVQKCDQHQNQTETIGFFLGSYWVIGQYVEIRRFGIEMRSVSKLDGNYRVFSCFLWAIGQFVRNGIFSNIRRENSDISLCCWVIGQYVRNAIFTGISQNLSSYFPGSWVFTFFLGYWTICK